jgi:hypothetical protein
MFIAILYISMCLITAVLIVNYFYEKDVALSFGIGIMIGMIISFIVLSNV